MKGRHNNLKGRKQKNQTHRKKHNGRKTQKAKTLRGGQMLSSAAAAASQALLPFLMYSVQKQLQRNMDKKIKSMKKTNKTMKKKYSKRN